MATVLERVIEVIVDILGLEEKRDEVVPGASFVDDLGADSLGVVELVMKMEEEFSKGGRELNISDDEASRLTTVQDAVDYLKSVGVEDDEEADEAEPKEVPALAQEA